MTTRLYLAAHRAHDIAFEADVRNPAYTVPLALEKFVAKDERAYMAMTTR